MTQSSCSIGSREEPHASVASPRDGREHGRSAGGDSRNRVQRRTGPRQGHQGLPHRRQDRSARGLCQADRERLHAGPGISHQGHHEGRRRQARDPGQGRPAQARPRQVPAGGVLQRRQGRHRGRHHGLADRARHAAGRRGEEENPDRRAGGGRQHHRRQVEPLHLPHRPQLLPGRAGRRRRLPQERRRIARHARPRHGLRPRRRRRLQGRRWPASAPTSRSSPRSTRRATRPTSRHSPSACSTRSRTRVARR